MASFNTGTGSKLLAPGLREVVFQAYNEQPGEYTRIFNIETSERAYEETLEFVGLGQMPLKNEGDSVTYVTPTQGEIKRFTHKSFAAGFRITREMMDDDLYNIVKGRGGRMAKELGKGGRNVREVYAANVFNNGFATADGFPKGGAAQTLFNDSHTLIGGGTYDNLAAADLGQASLEAAIVSFMTLVDENNIPVVCVPKTLLVPPALVMVARELLGSEYKPYTANNEINPTRVDRLDLDVNHYLTDSDAWFVLAGKSDHRLQFIVRTDLEYHYQDDFDTLDMKNLAFQRFSVGYDDWRGTYGSPGA